ncbi:MAG: dienelactone hydrolase family protein [Alphaproteobacteria bacterium]
MTRLLAALALLVLATVPVMADEAVKVDKVEIASTTLRPGQPPAPVVLAGWFSRPRASGPVPAILLMHGCSGPGRNQAQWRRLLHGEGYAVLALDSFGGRGVKEICSDFSRVTDRERQGDAFAALDWLARWPEIRADRIAVIGFSHGGGIALDLATRPLVTFRPSGAAGFRASIAFYPACRPPSRRDAEYAIPTAILIGENDDWTLAPLCRELKAESRGIPIELTVLPDAHHGFDVAGLPVTTRPDVRNLNKPTGWGATVGGNAAAQVESETLVKAFLARRM